MHLSTAYFPPIHYFCKILQAKDIWIEQEEHFLKQSYRNRCIITSSNGRIPLTIPVKRANSGLPIKEVEIDYTEDWQQQHYRTLLTAYGSSPFFEFYIDDLKKVFNERIPLLWELNKKILNICCELLQIDKTITYTNKYESHVQEDFRLQIHPKKKFQKEDKTFAPKPYWQPFSETLGFQENLSILDLIFNMGTESEIYLLSCIQ